MIISGHQPEYLPYLGFFYKMAMADRFVLVDHIQFSTGGFQNRNRIKTSSDPSGWAWLTVPVISSKKGFQKINEVKIDNSVPWAKKHWSAIYFNYKRAPFFNLYEEDFKKIYSKKWEKLVDLNESIIYYLREQLKIETPISKSSDLEHELKGKKTNLMIELCETFGADTHLTGPGAKKAGEKTYIDEEIFEKKGLKHVFSDFKHPIYPQRFEPFVENLSAIDLLFNCGPESQEIIKTCSDENQQPGQIEVQVAPKAREFFGKPVFFPTESAGQTEKTPKQKTTIITIHQPEYLPYIGFFGRMANADAFVVLDDVNYQKNGFINRNKIKTKMGEKWITVPVLGRSPHKKINNVLIDNSKNWGVSHWGSLLSAYSKTPYFYKYADFFKEVYSKKWELISDLDIYLIENINKFLGIDAKILKSSEMSIKDTSTERLIKICQKLNADIYISGPGNEEHQVEKNKFDKNKIAIEVGEFASLRYPQAFPDAGFLPYMSIVDLLFNCGPESLKIIKLGGKIKIL